MKKPSSHNKLLYLFILNVVLAGIWGPIFIGLTIAGPTKHLSQQVIWVAIISYYANMMTNVATAAALWSSIVANKAHISADAAHAQSLENKDILKEHIDG